ncbi:MAG: Clp protease ClpP, partial [Lentisphaerae bacterium]|nr:Clp protease ClpP [Lentisphaerota bacterium]
MREIDLNGYIDEDVWFGDEITPESLHESLYGAENQHTDDVHIRLNSYGGSCNAATRMFDDIRAYPGNVRITISGTAASAATVLSMAADKLEMTPGSLWMIHDPSVVAWGNERDLLDSINLLRACKESILNMYSRRCRWNR